MKATTAPDRAIRFGYRPDLLHSELAGWLDHIRWIAALAVAASWLFGQVFERHTGVLRGWLLGLSARRHGRRD